MSAFESNQSIARIAGSLTYLVHIMYRLWILSDDIFRLISDGSDIVLCVFGRGVSENLRSGRLMDRNVEGEHSGCRWFRHLGSRDIG